MKSRAANRKDARPAWKGVRTMQWRWLLAGLIAGYVWGFGARADRVREAGREDGVRRAWEACRIVDRRPAGAGCAPMTAAQAGDTAAQAAPPTVRNGSQAAARQHAADPGLLRRTRAALAAGGLSQARAAQQIGLSDSALSQWAGRQIPRTDGGGRGQGCALGSTRAPNRRRWLRNCPPRRSMSRRLLRGASQPP